jgi:predicted DNA-binding transcriptional regulator AlpA
METSAAALCMASGADEADERYLPGPKVAARYDVSDMTLYRWLRDERMQFPQPHYFGRLRFWKLSALTAWERERASARPSSDTHSR